MAAIHKKSHIVHTYQHEFYLHKYLNIHSTINPTCPQCLK